MQLEAMDSRSKIRTFSLLFCLFFSLYTLTFNGMFRLDDEHILAARTQSLALWGELIEPQVFGNQRVQALIPLGDAATQIEPGQAVLGAALMKAAQAFDLGAAQSLFSLNILLTALCAGLVYLIVVELKYARRVAIWCALFFGAGSMAWPYAQTYFRDTLAMSMSTLAFLGWARLHGDENGRRRSSFVLLGVSILGGVLAKNNVAVLVPALACVTFTRWLRSRKTRVEWLRLFLIVLGIILGCIGILTVLPGKGPFARYTLNYYFFLAGHFWESISIDLLPATLGPFLSPAKSIFLFSPPLLLGLISLRRIAKGRHRDYSLLVLLFAGFLAGAQGLFYRERWAGDFGWGLRFMLPAIPVLATLLAPIIESVLNEHPVRGKHGLSVVLALGVVVQLCAVLVPWHQAYDHMQTRGLDPYASSAAWDVRSLAIPYQVSGLFSAAQWTVVWRRLFLYRTLGVSIMVLAAVALGGVAIRGIIRERWLQKIPMRVFVAAVLFVFSIVSILTWWAAAGDPAWGDNRPAFHLALVSVSREISTHDVVLLDSYGTTLWNFWMNRWSLPQRWYSLPFSIPGSTQMENAGSEIPDDVERLINDLRVSADSIWYVTSDETADFENSPDREWLERIFSLGSCEEFKSGSRVEVCKYTRSK
jgi:hypothetical protein